MEEIFESLVICPFCGKKRTVKNVSQLSLLKRRDMYMQRNTGFYERYVPNAIRVEGKSSR